MSNSPKSSSVASIRTGGAAQVILSASLLMLAWGCASDSTAPAPQTTAEVSAAQPAVTPPRRPDSAEMLKNAASQSSAPFEDSGWRELWDGVGFDGWRVTAFAGHGEVELQSGMLILNMGDPFTGVNWTNSFPRMNYEIAFDAMRVMGTDFFCGLTVPMNESCFTLIVGGWGGSLFGISSLDGMDASENETMKFKQFETGRWYRVRLRVTGERLEGWIDQEKLLDLDTKERRLSVRPGDIELSKPVGIASWQTTGAFRNIKIREVDQPADPQRRPKR
ncbi:MAG TPA: family 16 glycoside hydrolase [Clostridia bacterium]|nr:family 16 glycoside hydrolase [Clostridia bacterium]